VTRGTPNRADGAAEGGPNRRRLLVAAAIVATVGAVAIALLWANRPSSDDIPPDVRASAAAAHRYFESLSTVPADSPEAVVATLRKAPSIPGQVFTTEVSAERKQKLLQRVAEWLRLRHDGDPDAYADWARSRGCHLTLTRDDVEERFFAMSLEQRQATYEYFTGEQLAPDMSPLDYFRWSFRTSLSFNDGLLRPAAIADGAQGAVVLFKRPPPGQRLLPLQDWGSDELWSSGWTAGCAVHWAPPVLLDDVRERHGELLGALVGIAVKSVEGDWAPTFITAYWAPSRQDWYFHQVSYSNTRHYNSWYDI